MTSYHFFQSLWHSFYDADFYREIGQRGQGWGLLHLFLVLSLFWIPQLIHLQQDFVNEIGAEAEQFFQQVPAIVISDGTVLINEPMPYRIQVYNPVENDTLIVVIDTSGTYTDPDQLNAKLLLTKHELIVKQSESETQRYNLQEIETFIINEHRMREWFKAFQTWFAVFMYPFLVFASYIFRLAEAFLLAWGAHLWVKPDMLAYRTLVRLMIVSLTPVIIIKTLLSVVGIPPVFWLMFPITVGYYLFALRANLEAPPQSANP
ncbi:MAG: DUF1189 domain-containing protein [Gemmatimonadetes bacterium]|nr:MAG: DUF1189 domain-containing protein [Gemmatimonadota bacterium]